MWQDWIALDCTGVANTVSLSVQCSMDDNFCITETQLTDQCAHFRKQNYKHLTELYDILTAYEST